jgi:hypothetical protein
LKWAYFEEDLETGARNFQEAHGAEKFDQESPPNREIAEEKIGGLLSRSFFLETTDAIASHLSQALGGFTVGNGGRGRNGGGGQDAYDR